MRIEAGSEVPVQQRQPDAIDLFMFSASAWLLHRIHYDLPFTTENDGHPGLLIHGPLQGTYMMQSVQWWLGPGAELTNISYRHSAPAYLGDVLLCGGTVTQIDDDAGTFAVDLWVKKQSLTDGDDDGDGGSDGGGEIVTTSGVAIFRLPGSLSGSD